MAPDEQWSHISFDIKSAVLILLQRVSLFSSGYRDHAS